MHNASAGESLKRIKKQFLCSIPLKEFEFDWEVILCFPSIQELILNNTVCLPDVVKYPVKLDYQRLFLKILIDRFEKQGSVIEDCVYEEYGRVVALPSNNVCFKHYLIEKCEKSVILEENINFISEGTTGLRTWQASLALSEWIIQNLDSFHNRTVLELGAGTGLAGLTTALCCSPKKVFLTDCHSSVLKTLQKNVKLNIPETESTLLDPSRQVEVVDLSWEDVCPDLCKSFGHIDTLIAADVVYDETLFIPLLRAVDYLFQHCGIAQFILSCTVRNKLTLDKFTTLLSCSFGRYKLQDLEVPPQDNFLWSTETPIRIYTITQLKEGAAASNRHTQDISSFCSLCLTASALCLCSIHRFEMGERKGTKGLELWCRRMTDGYPGVKVVNMTTSWRDGLAFCAIIHHFRPDLIDFSKLNKDDVYHNNELAFRVAESHLGIPALLEPGDMVEYAVPDRLSILTYLSQFYQAFVASQGKSTARIAPKRPATTPDLGIVSPASTSPPTKVWGAPVVGKVRREPCAKCHQPVFIAERLNVGKLLYHRTCFRCARCSSQLTLANSYETESGEYCCETCPDEEAPMPVLERSLSDEEKCMLREDEYSALFESALEGDKGRSARYSKARASFITSQVTSDTDEPPDIPASKPPLLPKPKAFSGFPKDTLPSGNNSLSMSSVGTKEVEDDPISTVESRMRFFEGKSNQQTDEVPSSVVSAHTKPQMDLDIITIKKSEVNDSFEKNLQSSEISTNVKEEEIPSPLVLEETLLIKQEESSLVPEETDKVEEEQSTLVVENTNDTSIITVLDSSEEMLVNNPQAEIDTSVITILDSTEEENSNSIPQEPLNESNDVIYPDDLNPFGDEECEENSKHYNPFDDEEEVADTPPKPAVRRKIIPFSVDRKKLSTVERISVNPFEDDEDEEPVQVPQPAQRRIIDCPKLSLSPYWNEVVEKPTAKPRGFKTSMDAALDVKLAIDETSNFGGSANSLNSTQSLQRKKKPAPKPPSKLSGTESGPTSLASSPCPSACPSPRGTPKFRKTKKAPLPPTSTPRDSFPPPLHISLDQDSEEKNTKNEVNKNRQSHHSPVENSNETLSGPDKSTFGKWKRRKGQAPPRPIPQRQIVRPLPIAELKKELEMIEVQQQGLERQGVRLEQMIREQCEGPNANLEDALPLEVDEMILQLFELVNEKNELFRKQAELMYLRRQQKLEEEQADVDYQIRMLSFQRENILTDSDKAKEEELIQRLVDIVKRRDEVVQCLEMDRLREAEEDDSIQTQVNLYTLHQQNRTSEENKSTKKEKKKHKKEKKSKSKVDIDKDIDESEATPSTSKEKKKKILKIF